MFLPILDFGFGGIGGANVLTSGFDGLPQLGQKVASADSSFPQYWQYLACEGLP